VTDTLSADLNYLGNLWSSSGTYGESGGVITWTGSVGSALPVTITYGVTVSALLVDPQAISNTVLIDDGDGNVLQRWASVIVNAHSSYLPLVLKEGP
jgi:hypothetical protein